MHVPFYRIVSLKRVGVWERLPSVLRCLRFMVCFLFFFFHFYFGCNVHVKSFYFGILKETKSGPDLLSRCHVPLRMPL